MDQKASLGGIALASAEAEPDPADDVAILLYTTGRAWMPALCHN